jgi:hypothetical protein
MFHDAYTMTDGLDIPDKLSEWTKGGIVEHIGSDEEHTDTFYRHGNLGAEQDKDGTWEAYTIVDGHPIKVKGDMMSFEEVVEFFKGSFCSKRLADGKEEEDDVPDAEDEPEHPQGDDEAGVTFILKSITEMMSTDYDGCAVTKSKKGGDGKNPNVRKKPKNLGPAGEDIYKDRGDVPDRKTAYEKKNTETPQHKQSLTKKTPGVSAEDIPKNVLHGGYSRRRAANLNNAYKKPREGGVNVVDKDGRLVAMNPTDQSYNSIVHMGMSPNEARYAMMMDLRDKGHGDFLARKIYTPDLINYKQMMSRKNKSPYMDHMAKDGSISYPSVMGLHDDAEQRILAPTSIRFASGGQRIPQVPGTAGIKDRYSRGSNPGDFTTVNDFLKNASYLGAPAPRAQYKTLDDLFEAIDTSDDPAIAGLRKYVRDGYNKVYGREAMDAREEALKAAELRRNSAQDKFRTIKNGSQLMKHLDNPTIPLPEGTPKEVMDVVRDYHAARSEYDALSKENKRLNRGRGKQLKGSLKEYKEINPKEYAAYEWAVANMLSDASFQAQADWLMEQGRDPKYHWIPLPSFFERGTHYPKNSTQPISENSFKTETKLEGIDPDFSDEENLSEILGRYNLYDDVSDSQLNPYELIYDLRANYPKLYEKYGPRFHESLAESILENMPEDFDFNTIKDPIRRMVARDHAKSAKEYLDTGVLKYGEGFLGKVPETMMDSIRAFEYGGVPFRYMKGQKDDAKKVSEDGVSVSEGDIDPRLQLIQDVHNLNKLAIQTGISHDPSFRKAFGKRLVNGPSTEYIGDEDLVRLQKFLYGDGDADLGYMAKYGSTFNDAISKDYGYDSPEEYIQERERRKRMIQDHIDNQIANKAILAEDVDELEQKLYDSLPKYRSPESSSEPAEEAPETINTVPEPVNDAPVEPPSAEPAQTGSLTDLGTEILSKGPFDADSENPLKKSISVMIMEKMSCGLTKPEGQEPNLMPLNEYPRSIIMGAGKVAIPDPQHVKSNDVYRTYPVKGFPDNFPGKGE